MKKRLEFKFLNRPGMFWTDEELNSQVEAMREVAASCLDEVPLYQCLSGERTALSRNIIVQAIDRESGELAAFCSAVLMRNEDQEHILHLGLTCVSPKYRGLKLTHHLTSRILKGYFLNYSLFKTIWITNVACVLSSLGNVAKYFENVYPSPFQSYPSRKHLQIAKTVSSRYRKDFYVREDVRFNPVSFVFEGSVKDNSFEKSALDTCYYHRDPFVNNFYKQMINFERGDEVLQVGKVNIFTFLKYGVKKLFKRKVRISEFFEVEHGFELRS